jgi:hypothetical protein
VWVALLFALYPLSAGPLAWYYHHRLIGTPAGNAFLRTCEVVYYPIGWLTRHSEWVMYVATKYDHWCVGD